ncbi:sarcosine oxidase subunit gamma [Actinoplanes sp. G11-F43]|uniref:sarcosine oxidase subunit gamma n=1 Tax=Actinoplanes sp. G11-F43 TaxID=3424130 RepID=UPI003D3352F3
MTADRTTPLTGVPLPSMVVERPFLTQLNLRLDREPPAEPGVTLLRLGPDEWLAIGPPDAQERLTARYESVAGASVVDVSAQRTTLELSGPGIRELLALGCSLDLHPSMFAVGDHAQTTLAHTPVILLRREPVFWLMVRASFAAHLAGWLIDASRDLTGGH